MKKSTLPKYIQPLEFAEKGTLIQGKIKLQELKRLAELILEKNGEVTITLQFGKDRENFCFISGQIQTTLGLSCQRCLRPMAYPLNISVNLSPVFNEAAAKRLPERYEPLMITEDPLLLADMIEDELLLALPMVAKHEQCASETII